ncbi:uncharacterized protein BDFB_012794, partial [Asbolus verrucosus]
SVDPFLLIRKLFIDYGYSKFTKIINKLFLVFHSVVFLLQAHYIISNFSLDFLARYGCMMTFTAYILNQGMTNMSCSIIIEAKSWKILNDHLNSGWSIDSAGQKARKAILKKAKIFNNFSYLLFVFFAIKTIIMYPAFGGENELILCVEVFDKHFGTFSKIPYFFYFASLPFFSYSCLRLCYVMTYATLQMQVQTFLICEHIGQISIGYDNDDELKKRHGICYQEDICKRLSFCIKHHIILKRIIKKLANLAQPCMIVLLTVSVPCMIGILSFILYYIEDASNILKIRLACMTTCILLIMYMFCKSGQALFDETSCIFDTLVNCPWYIWNAKNRKILLIFLINSLEPLKFSFAGITLDYRLAV